MKVQLRTPWELSDEHPASVDGEPVLVNRELGEAYGPGDVVECCPTYFMYAVDAVKRLVALRGDQLAPREHDFCRRFCATMSTGGQGQVGHTADA